MFDKGRGGFMEAVNSQKIKLLKLYEMLRQHTDEDRPLPTNQLCAMIKAEDIICDRRTLAEDNDILNVNGVEVLRRHTRYAMLFYIVDRRFDLAEVKILIDAIQAASFITPQKTKDLTDKVASLAGTHKVAVLVENLDIFNGLLRQKSLSFCSNSTTISSILRHSRPFGLTKKKKKRKITLSQ